MPRVRFTIITLFPEALQPYLNASMMWKAQDKNIAEFKLVNLRDYGLGPHKSVDDTPYGGGDGMLLRCEPIYAAIEELKQADPSAKVLLPTPAGRLWTQSFARELAAPAIDDNTPPPHYIILCPHYEGYDERILPLIDLPVSIGPYILTGGELPALAIVDSITRLLPGVLGGATSAAIESFSDGDNLEYPQYTKPADFRGLPVPPVLLSGHHGKIAAWRAKMSKARSAAARPSSPKEQ